MSVVPNLEPGCRSWIIVDRRDGRPVFETFNRNAASIIDQSKYEVLTALQWLQRFRSRANPDAHTQADPIAAE